MANEDTFRFVANVRIDGVGRGSSAEVRAELAKRLAEFDVYVNRSQPFTDEEVGDLVQTMGVATAIDAEVALRNFGQLIYEFLGARGLFELLGRSYDLFCDQFAEATSALILREARRREDTLESWLHIPGIQAVHMNTGAIYAGTLDRGILADYVLDTGTSTVPFNIYQVRNAVESYDGTRTILLDSQHPGVGVPQPISK